ncbi:DUF4011 domain-containing protein [Microlunatus sp. Y2014]|uniref:DUF4011 domain-containing protein n=1 Tax=Microlunatus sp. Y2014 TaxID=3418488 RepID=UPI003DA7442E
MSAPTLNYAMSHNELPFLDRVVIINRSAEALEEVVLTVEVRDDHGQLVSRPYNRNLDLPPSLPVTLDSPDIRLDPRQLSTLEEETGAEIIVRVVAGVAGPSGPAGQQLGISHSPLDLLAARQWQFDPRAPLLSLELLAAFVQPNHPAIGALLSATAERLADPRWVNRRPRDERSAESRTGGGSLDTTEVSPQRIDEIVEALVEVTFEHGIHYAAPPASWGYGQKVRTPGDVLDGKLGTCLDTTMLLAAALEQLGIGPVLWIATGHAFLGYWRRAGHHLPDAASLQVAPAVNAVDLGLVGVVETTFVTAERTPDRDVARRARQAPIDTWLRGRSSDLVGVVDVAEARLMKVLPVPARQVRPDGVVEVVEYRPAEPAPAAAPLPAATSPAEPGATPRPVTPVPPRVQQWKNSLLDLTLRNKLLNMGSTSSQLPLVLPPEHLGVLADHLQSERSVVIRALDDLTGQVATKDATDAWSLPGDVLRTMLTQRATIYSGAPEPFHRRTVDALRYRARTITQETGANPLMVTLGRLEWQLADRDLVAPLLLCPVEVRGTVMPFRIAYDTSGQITLNLSLMEKLRHEFGLVIPGLDPLPAGADGGVDVDAVVRIVREALVAGDLPFRVASEARLAAVQFTGYLLWRDLDQHWEQFCEVPLVKHLVYTPTLPWRGDDPEPAPDTDADVPDLSDDPAGLTGADGMNAVDASAAGLGLADLDDVVAACPIPADGSQAVAVASARAGRNFVLEGPPGTGKSQTITNIVADQLAQGRSVLFVAEKGAALDVVRQRLGDAGLLPFTLDLHDRNARPTQVRAKLAAALRQTPEVDTDGYRVDAAAVTTTARTLSRYAEQLHAPNVAGLSLYQARNRLLAQGEGTALTISSAELAALSPAASDAVRRAVTESIPLLAELGDADDQPWSFVRTLPDLTALPALLERADRTVARVRADVAGPAADVVRRARTVAEIVTLQRLLGSGASPDQLDRTRAATWQQARQELQGRTDRLVATAAPMLQQFTPEVFHVDLGPVRQELRIAASSFFIGRKGRILRAAAPVLDHLRPGVDLRPRDLPDLVEQLAAIAGDHRALVAAWRAMPALSHLPQDLLLVDESNRRRLADTLAGIEADQAAVQQLPAELVADARRCRRDGHVLGATGAEAVAAAGQALGRVFAATGSGPDDQRRLATAAALVESGSAPGEAESDAAQGLVEAWAATAAGRETDGASWTLLRRWVAVRDGLAPLDDTLPTARDQLLAKTVSAQEAAAGLERGIARATVDERWEAGGFTTFDPESHDRTASRFVASADRLRQDLRTVLPAAVVERRPFGNGGAMARAGVGRVGALEREVGRSRGGLSVRRLIEKFGKVIGEVTPCVLVSPDSLARFIAPGAMTFDLVVFDEASQIRVPDAIGAIGRARAVVVAGDSKQMPPTSMFTESETDVEVDPDDDYAVVTDEESILSEAVQARVPRLWLSWHYRSRDESLISFSNREYYDGRLASFPAVPGASDDLGLSFTRVPGRFIRSVRKGEDELSEDDQQLLAELPPAARRAAQDRSLLRTNPVEAVAVVQEVLRRWERRERSIGVVTFNVQQRGLIERMLWESEVPGVAESLAERSDGLFVKNLENVQGDERDVILFSTGFSANHKGVLPLNFGPLNRSGGERRLNVAITRARRRVMVFSSFDPEDMRVEQTSSVGLKHLRAYLEVARDGHAIDPDDGTPAISASRVVVDRHRDAIAAALRANGLTVRTGLGLSEFQVDLAVGVGDSPVLAVLLDSPAWRARLTTGDRDALPYTVLRSLMGWPGVSRIWLPDWLTDPDRVVARITEEANRAHLNPHQVGERWVVTSDRLVGTDDPEPTPEAPAAATTDGDPTDADDAGPVDEPGGTETPTDDGSAASETEADGGRVELPVALGGAADESQGVDFVPFEPRRRGGRGSLDTALRRPEKVRELIMDIVTTEGPITPVRLARHFVGCYGLTRLTASRQAEVAARIPTDLRRDPEEGFVWPESRDPLRWQGFRHWDGPTKERPLDDVPLREIGNAMAHLARSSMGVEESELISETCRVFGGSRVTEGIGARLRAALALAVDRKQVVVRAGIVTAVPT